MTWRAPCSHGRYEAHSETDPPVEVEYSPGLMVWTRHDCPGGSSVTTKDLDLAHAQAVAAVVLEGESDVFVRRTTQYFQDLAENLVGTIAPLLIREEQ